MQMGRRGRNGQEAGGQSRTTVLVVRPGQLGWAGLGPLIEGDPNMELVGDISCPAEGVQVARMRRPDAILLAEEVARPSLVGLLEELHVNSPESKIVLLGRDVDRTTRAALRLQGVHGYIRGEGITGAEILHFLTTVVTFGRCVMDRDVMEELASPTAAGRYNGVPLGKQKRAVLRGLRAGLRERQIAGQDGIGERTVQRIVAKLLVKLGARSVAELVTKVDESDIEP